MNTIISFLYRDGSNYKVYNELVVPGIFTDEEIDEIISSLDMGEYFIPEQVGLPVERFAEVTEDDHCWCELTRSGFSQTAAKPTIDLTPDEITKNFMAAKDKWDAARYS